MHKRFLVPENPYLPILRTNVAFLKSGAASMQRSENFESMRKHFSSPKTPIYSVIFVTNSRFFG